ncbi:MAG TPA: YciI family protein [Lacunisphaera sp.]|nr:YciI family protein [Lacunisphaera sp.]
MNKYLCLVYFELKELLALSREERVVLDRESLAYDATLKKGGHFIAAQALQSPSKARTVSVRRGRRIVTDGPFAETKEQLGGFILIQAKNLAQAVRLGAGIPLAKLGRIEVRPIYRIPVR